MKVPHSKDCGAIVQRGFVDLNPAEVNLNTVRRLNLIAGMTFDLFEIIAAPNDPQMSVNESIMVIKTQLTWQSGDCANCNSSNTAAVSCNACENKEITRSSHVWEPYLWK